VKIYEINMFVFSGPGHGIIIFKFNNKYQVALINTFGIIRNNWWCFVDGAGQRKKLVAKIRPLEEHAWPQ